MLTLNLAETAKTLGVSRNTIYSWVRAGKLERDENGRFPLPLPQNLGETKPPPAPTARDAGERVFLARRWGEKSGYRGAPGGYVVNDQGKRICRGWQSLYDLHWEAIEETA
jgi:hypothetical protein